MASTQSDPFDGLLASFDLALEAEQKSDNTRYQYGLAVTKFAYWLTVHGKTSDASEVAAADVRAWLVSLHGNVAPSTEYRNYSGTRQFFKWLVAEGELEHSPMENVRPPKVPEQRTEMLTQAQMKALLADCAGKDLVSRRDTAIVMLFADTGVRLSELANLTLDDVDVRGRLAHVIGKGRRPRTIAFGARTAQAVDRYLRSRRQHALAHQDHLWLGEKNRQHLTAEGVKQMLKRRGDRLGIRIHAHMFRHGFADAWLKAGGAEGDLQELAGWKSPQMVRRYAAANRAERARANYRRLSPMDSL